MLAPAHRTAIGIGLASLRANPLRTILSTLGIIMGAAALAAVLTMSDGVEAFARGQIERTTDVKSVVIQPLRNERLDGLLVPLEHPVRATSADLNSLQDALGELAEAVLKVEGTLIHDSAGSRRAVLLVGATGPLKGVVDSSLVAGLIPDASAWLGSGSSILISKTLARRLSSDLASLVGRPVEFSGATFDVAGVIDDGNSGQLAMMAPFETATAVLASRPQPPLPSIIVRALRVEDVEAARTRVESWLADQPGDWTKGTRVVSMRRQLQQIKQGMTIFKILMGSITGIALAVGGIGIMNVLLASVAERTREIGVRKAVGARRRDIVLQFLSESVTIALVGSAIGVVLGLLTAVLATNIMRQQTEALVHPVFTAETLVVSALAAITVGLVFGTYPALRASRLDPIAALRHD